MQCLLACRVKFIHIARFLYDLTHGTKRPILDSRLDQPRGLLCFFLRGGSNRQKLECKRVLTSRLLLCIFALIPPAQEECVERLLTGDVFDGRSLCLSLREKGTPNPSSSEFSHPDITIVFSGVDSCAYLCNNDSFSWVFSNTDVVKLDVSLDTMAKTMSSTTFGRSLATLQCRWSMDAEPSAPRLYACFEVLTQSDTWDDRLAVNALKPIQLWRGIFSDVPSCQADGKYCCVPLTLLLSRHGESRACFT